MKDASPVKDKHNVSVGQCVGWTETYRTAENVVAKRTEWGVVKQVFDYTDRGHSFPLSGPYVLVDQSGHGRGLGAVLVDDLHTVFPL